MHGGAQHQGLVEIDGPFFVGGAAIVGHGVEVHPARRPFAPHHDTVVDLVVLEQSVPRLLPLEGAHVTLPSALFFDFETGTDHFGRDAIELYTDGRTGRLMRSLKSVLGTGLMAESTRIRSRLVPFEDILGKFIKHLKVTAEQQLGMEITDVVMGRPTHFIDDDEMADSLAEQTLEKIARKQGFKHIRFQLEPIAAALDYERSLTGESLAVIADIGGGTADFTVARLGPGKSRNEAGRVLANGGVHIGGTDMDRVLSVSQVMPLFGLGSKSKDGRRNLPVWPFNDLATWHRINSLSDSQGAGTAAVNSKGCRSSGFV